MGIEQPQTRTAVVQPTAVRRATLAQAELVNWFAEAYGEVAAYLGLHGLTPKGHPFARYHVRADGRFDVEAGFPIAGRIAGDCSVQPSTLPGGELAVVWYMGPYDQVGKAYATLADWISSQGGEADGEAWEIYYEPPTGDPSHWRTEVVQPYHLVSGDG
ncbi:effector-binding domain-containing protein [Kribbella orskensis]|uniref:Effector-binding domain-containing protein n=1 Tax=Kribbella orskensis TaxID=2512216 RepID=A0ABY2B5L9_9ACTN|nr:MULTISPECIES: GyrI-like domain-containing protein [Kribbella]TCN27054.1 effector-binding domain-containing protein [Kribbella sp. VKM Ac-2500]TCO07516.1 effector-binding domain-containing protein [Kribbella orskensis]